MSILRKVGVLLVGLSVGAPVDMFACGEKFLLGFRGTRYQRPKNARAASILIYADPGSAVAAAINKENIDSVLRVVGLHRVTKVKTLEILSRSLSTGHYDLILTSNGDKAEVERRLPTPDASTVIGIDDLLKNHSLLPTIDKEVLQRDQNSKKTVKR